MKKLIITVILIFITIVSAYNQTLNSISSNKISILKDSNDSRISFRIKPVYTFVQRTSGWEYFTNGFGATFTIQFDLGKMVSTFIDFNYSSIEYFNNNKDHLTPPVYIHENKPSFMFVGGAKFYPFKSTVPAYIKGGLGILARQNGGPFPPLLNLGIGCEYKISEIFNVFVETEADYYSGINVSKLNQSTDLSIGLGVSVYYQHFFKISK